MVFKIEKFKFKRDFDKIQALGYIQILFICMAIIDEWSKGVLSNSTLIIKLVIFLSIYRLTYKFKAKFNYSYWPLATVLFIYYFFKAKLPFLFNIEIYHLLYFSLMFILFLEMYLLSSPIYYPRVMWWEYDFRYKDDLKVKIQMNELKADGRLTDLRRNAGCIHLFNDLPIGSYFEFIPEDEDVFYKVKIISKRIEIIGRPILYGVKFLLNDADKKNKFNKLYKHYKNSKKQKQELKLSDFKLSNE